VITSVPETPLKYRILLSALLFWNPLILMAQSTRFELADANVRKAIGFVDAHNAQTAEFLASIAAIVSPSGDERERAEPIA
jgi:hypothetical protein